MRKDQFQIHAAVEDHHWWFTARRNIIIDHIAKHHPRAKFVAEIGCGTGGNLKELESRGYDTIGVDGDGDAVALANNRIKADVLEGDFEVCLAPYWERIDVVLLADVLEHVADDQGMLRRVWDKIEPGTLVVITVPALQSLWSVHDEVLGHYRRYNVDGLGKLVRAMPHARVVQLSYFNFFLFPPVYLVRSLKRLLPGSGAEETASDLELHHPTVNRILAFIFEMERPWLRRGGKFPVGSSALAIISKEQS
ncbi:MAG: class I SAM-dependent methyltransferase [Pseudomonadales bacterium]|nr:class I SAM-dependent methyltransferase [Pseudomonadales bacterium]